MDAAPTEGLVAYYPLDGNAKDMSGKRQHAKVKGTKQTTNKFGHRNTALFFDGTTDLITLPLQQNGVLKLTYSVWFKTSTGGVLLGHSFPNNPGLVLAVHTAGTGGAGAGSALWVADAAGVSVGGNSSPIYNDNQWHHMVGVFDGVAGELNPAQFSIYIDGKLISKNPQNVNPPNVPINLSSIRIGSNERWVAMGGNFTGSIDEVRIYARALDAEEVKKIYYFDSKIVRSDELVDNDPKESETEEQPETAPLPLTTPEVAASNINPLELLAQEGSNMIAWVTSPLDVDIPDNFRANISLLREDLLDGHAEGSASPEIYQSAVELCDNLMACIDKKEKQQIDAKLRVAQAKQRSPLSNQALDARRNYLMSWPQYHREVRQREVLAEEKGDNTEVKVSELELAWIETAGKLRKALDVKYSAYRAALRKK